MGDTCRKGKLNVPMRFYLRTARGNAFPLSARSLPSFAFCAFPLNTNTVWVHSSKVYISKIKTSRGPSLHSGNLSSDYFVTKRLKNRFKKKCTTLKRRKKTCGFFKVFLQPSLSQWSNCKHFFLLFGIDSPHITHTSGHVHQAKKEWRDKIKRRNNN